MSEVQSTQANAEIREASKMLARVRDEVSRAVVGQAEMIDGLLMGVLANGHVLLEGVPGLAKTLAVKTISAVIDSSFKRIQCTPELLPAVLV